MNLLTQDNRNRAYDPVYGRWLQRDPQIYADSMNLYLYVLNSPLTKQDPSGMTTKADIDRGRLVYSCNCGWIDWKHAEPGSAMRAYWNTILTESGARSLTRNGFNVTLSQGSGVLGIELMRGLQSAFVPYGVTLEEKKGIALDIFKKVSEQHEGIQLSWEGWGTSSGFSEEDLVSNLIAFYRTVEHYSRSLVESERVCHVLTKEQSKDVWNSSNGLFKNKTWKPVYHYSPCCPNKRVPIGKLSESDQIWLRYFQTIQPNQSWSPWEFNVDYKLEHIDPVGID